jgi:4-diphosphocytidyl-2-C-methyl-D-erythritol kinase
MSNVVASGADARTIHVQAPAKINLFLHLVGRRADGFHLLDSLIAFTDYGDELSAETARDLSLAINGSFSSGLSTGDDNLVLRAARMLMAEGDIAQGARLQLTKSLPVASGIGGGSADAVAAMKALINLWGVKIPAARLAALALKLGADLPVCLAGQPSFVGGIGEDIQPLPPMPDLDIVLVNPLIPLPTVEVFRRRAKGPDGNKFGGRGRWTKPPTSADEFLRYLAGCRNDLTDAAIGIVPAIANVLAAIGGQTGCRLARLSGSGATCFGLFADADAAALAAAAIRKAEPGWWAVATKLRLSGTSA